MITGICFNADWLTMQSRALKIADAGMLERALHAFALLGHLAESGLDFVFKGGTSLLLHTPRIRRLSIDIDILCTAPPTELDRVLAEIATKQPFVRYEEDARGARGLPHRRHFKFYYPTIISTQHILLDVVEESDIPHELIEKAIRPPILAIERDVLVRIPTIESLLADKMTAFAPHTVGVPVVRSDGRPVETMQIMKQLFDVGELFDLAENVNAVRAAYSRVFQLESNYRGGQFTMRGALQDTLDMSLRYCLAGFKGAPRHADVDLLEDGRKRLESHLVDHRFDQAAAKTAAAKAALLAVLLLTEPANASLAHWRAIPDMKILRGLEIASEWRHLNRLKSILPEAFYYWYQAALANGTRS